MNVFTEHQQAAIGALCTQYRVQRLEVFGSFARGDFESGSSDVDFLVEFEPLGWEGSFKRYMGLKLDLEDLLQRPVDLVESSAVTNSHFLNHIARDRRPVYAA
jgi:uncharacterized protein